MSELRIVVTGAPRAGKTTLAAELHERLGHPLRATDGLMNWFEWSDLSAFVAERFDDAGPWIVEGVAATRALRKWLKAHPEGKPCDVVYCLATPHPEAGPLSRGQTSMVKACATIWSEIEGELVERGVGIRSETEVTSDRPKQT